MNIRFVSNGTEAMSPNSVSVEDFCEAVGGALGAVSVLLAEPLPEGGLALLHAWRAEDAEGNDRAPSPGEGLCGSALLTGQVVSRREDSPDGPRARFAVPVFDSRRRIRFAVEVLKAQPEPAPSETDLQAVRTFGALFATANDAIADEIRPNAGVARSSEPTARNPAPAPAPVGKSSAFTRSQLLAMKAARSDSPVLILGETGTGKELVASQLHAGSRRRNKPFVAINCGALTETLLESELFGHARGSFTGAFRARKGRLEEADGGTVFLDEIAEMSPACQVRLLRTLDTGEIVPVGSNRILRIDVRFIAATHRDLESMIRDGAFRQDLFYRLQGMRVELPPLRRRRGDIELLTKHFFESAAAAAESPARGFSPDAMRLLLDHDWPGNVRELRQVVANAVAMAEGEWIEPADLPSSVRESVARRADPAGEVAPESASPAEDERRLLLEALRATAYPATGRWNLRAAARRLGMNHQTLGYKVRKVHKLEND